MMEYVAFVHSSPKPKSADTRVPKKCLTCHSPIKLTLSGNFTHRHKDFDVILPERRASMRRDILDTVMKRTETALDGVYVDDNPMYEDPRDVIGEKPPKPPRKRNLQPATSSPKEKESRSTFKEQKRKLTRKYEGLITALIERCEENVALITEKDNQIAKLKDKLKTVLEYNKLFAEENDQLKSQYETLAKYIEECKNVIKEERERNIELEGRSKELEDRVKRFEVPDREHSPSPSTAIPLVEVCMSCSSRQIILNQARDQNTRLQKDMQALKDVLYRLNVQLSRYQERLRSNVQTMASDHKTETIYKPGDKFDGLESIIASSIGCRDTATQEDGYSNKCGPEDQQTRMVDLSGLLSAQALAPLFDAYQENLQEKDSLILDYEKQFEIMNKKSKQIVEENKSLSEKVNLLEEDLARTRQSYKRLAVERETGDIERATLLERAERAEAKLKEVYEMYEDKMAAMMRDYETVHREYFAVRNALEATEGKIAQVDAFRARTVPADLHERRLEHCKRLLEELKHQYSMENERKTEQLKKMEERARSAEEKCRDMCRDHMAVTGELAAALKNVRLYRKAAVIFRQRVKAATARVNKVRRSARRMSASSEPLRQALSTLERIKSEIKVVKSRASTSLEELERRIKEQERKAAHAQAEYRRELERVTLVLEHKEGIIRSLIDKVADVEEVRLSQTNTHRLQGIVSDSEPSPPPPSEGPQGEGRKPVKLVHTGGGYYQEKEGRRKGKGQD